MAAKLGEIVLFVATGESLDNDVASGNEEHKRFPPSSWRTLEMDIKVGQNLKEQIGDADVVLLDCSTELLQFNFLVSYGVLRF